MSRKTRILHCLAVAVSVLAAPRPAAPQTYECREVMVPMRDGVRLATDVYLPTQGTGPWPVIMERTPYDKSDCSYPHADYFAARGYAVLIQDERGRYRSEGEYYWYRIFGPDGHDAVEWAGTQPWSSGKVGTMGLSFPCVNQYAILPYAPPPPGRGLLRPRLRRPLPVHPLPGGRSPDAPPRMAADSTRDGQAPSPRRGQADGRPQRVRAG